jgi:translation elongation factor EF-G
MRLRANYYPGMGELHLDILLIECVAKVEVNQGEPQVEYKEALQNLLNIEKHTKNNLRSW